MSPPVYRFLPWARRGLAQGALGDDGIGTQGAHRLPARSTLPVALDVNGVPAGATVQLYGPGDVTGIDRRVDPALRPARRAPPTSSRTTSSPSTSIRRTSRGCSRPPEPSATSCARGACSIVVERTEGVSIELRPGAVLPVLTIDAPADAERELPDLDDSWAWAHAQVLEEAGSNPGNDLHVDLDVDPDRNLSRLICPRLLRPDTRYYAAVVPAFDHGVQRGLGDAPTGDDGRPGVGRSPPSRPSPCRCTTGSSSPRPSPTTSRRWPSACTAPTTPRRRSVAAGSTPARSPPARPAADGAIVTMFGALRPPSTDTTVPMPAQDPGLTGRLTAARGTAGHRAAAAAAVRRVARRHPRAADAAPARLVRRAEHDRRPPHRRRPRRRGGPPPPGGVRRRRLAAGRADPRGQRPDRPGAPVGRGARSQVVARHVLPLPLDRMVQTVGPLLAGAAQPVDRDHVDRRRAGREQRADRGDVGGVPPSGQHATPVGQAGDAHRRGRSPATACVGLTAGGAGPAVVEPIRATPDGLVSLADRGVLEATAGADGTVSLAGARAASAGRR